MMNKKYLITGINGYIASFMTKYIKTLNPNSEIYGVLRKGSLLKEELTDLVTDLACYDKKKYLYLDRNNNELDFSKFDYVIHLATNFKGDNSTESIVQLLEDNLLSTIALYKQIEKSDKQPHLLVASSWSAYKNYGEFAPANPYSATKYFAEDSSKMFNLEKLTFLRISDTYGLNDTRPKIHNLLTRKENPIKALNSPAEQKINMTHIEDVTRAFLHCIENEYFDVADLYYKKNEVTLEELVKLLKLENVTFGDKEIAELPNQTKAIPNFKLKHNIKNIYKDLKRGE